MHAITEGAYDNNVPTWSRDGKSVYFSSNRTGRWEIWKHDIGTGVEAQITLHGGFSAFDSYDGRYLYYMKFYSPGIWRMPTGGGEERRVTDQPGPSHWGDWDLTETGLYFLNPDASPRPAFSAESIGHRMLSAESGCLVAPGSCVGPIQFCCKCARGIRLTLLAQPTATADRL